MRNFCIQTNCNNKKILNVNDLLNFLIFLLIIIFKNFFFYFRLEVNYLHKNK